MSRTASDPNRQILEEAATWFVVFRSQILDENTRQDFHDWLKRSPEHIRAYLEIASTYAEIPAPQNGRTPPQLIARAKASPDVNVVSLSFDNLTADDMPTPRLRGHTTPARGTQWPVRPRALAAVVVLASCLAGAWLYAERNTYGTDLGEQRSITLPDGSIVDLNARSRIHVAYRKGERDIELLSGQALFRVAKDPTRPFIVSTDNARVRAVGTQFDIYRKSSGTTVTVLEGRVRVARESPDGPTQPAADKAGHPGAESAQGSAQPAPRIGPMHKSTAGAASVLLDDADDMSLVAGEQMTVTSTSAQKVDSPNVAAATAWTQHQLVFDATPLSEVVEEFGRYSSRHLIIDSPELANLKISGQYMSADPESLLRFLGLQKGVTITEKNGETHIRKE